MLTLKIVTQFESLKITAKCLSFGSKSSVCTKPPTIIPSKSTRLKSYNGIDKFGEVSDCAIKTVSAVWNVKPYKTGSSVVANIKKSDECDQQAACIRPDCTVQRSGFQFLQLNTL